MAIVLDHTIVPARDKDASARFFARIMGLTYAGTSGHFAPVQVNDSLIFDFDNRDSFESHHSAFYISDDEFDATLAWVKAAGRTFGSGPMNPEDGEVNTRRGGRGFYFADLDGHLLEVMTRPEKWPESEGTQIFGSGFRRLTGNRSALQATRTLVRTPRSGRD